MVSKQRWRRYVRDKGSQGKGGGYVRYQESRGKRVSGYVRNQWFLT